MKNKHLLLLFLVAALSVWLWNSMFRKQDKFSHIDNKFAAEFLEKYDGVTFISIDDGTEPNIRLTRDEHGWQVNFGTLDAPADEDSIKAFLQAIGTLSLTNQLPAEPQRGQLKLQTTGASYWLNQHGANSYVLSDTEWKNKIGFTAPLSNWFSAPYEHWLFRKLQVKTAKEIQSLSFEWRQFEPLHLQIIDSTWQIPVGVQMEKSYIQDSILSSLTQLNQLEPALLFDPLGDAIKPFAQLHINDGKACTLSCYRLTETVAEYYIHSTNVPQLYFKLPNDLANQIFVVPMLKGMVKPMLE
jgi:hypothetical protein